MKSVKIFIISTLILLFSFVENNEPSFANDGQEQRIIKENVISSRANIIHDFVNIAFSKTLWNENGKNGLWNDFPVLRPKALDEVNQKYYPWIKAFFYGDEYPAHGVINKWQKKITIGIDWPLQGEFIHQARDGRQKYLHSGLSHWRPPTKVDGIYYYPDRTIEDVYPLFEEQIRKLLPEMTRLTGLPVEFIHPNDPRERTNEYARIRIVPITFTNQRNYFKTAYDDLVMKEGSAGEHDVKEYEREAWGAVAFTPSARAQVDGYFLPNSDNEIEMAVCKIMPVIGEDLIRALISECLLRALGFPEVSIEPHITLLAEWNKAHAEHSKLVSQDGMKQAFFRGGPNQGEAIPVKELDKQGKGRSTSSKIIEPHFPHKLTDMEAITQDWKAYDKLMVSLLYCPVVKSGMDKYQAIKALARDPKCLPPFHQQD